MKKLNLSIPTPCHENWDQMTQAEKGKFCGACQKTVVDFTNMSDRQLVDFFKKPKDDVCGRFNNDQLDRGILMPRKRIPWIRYFFQFTWPAFMLGLKSCTNPTTGKAKSGPDTKPLPNEIKLSPSEIEKLNFTTVGFALPEILPFEKTLISSVQMPNQTLGEPVQKIQSFEKPLPEPKLISCNANETVGIIATKIDKTNDKEDTIQAGPPMEPVTVVSYLTTGKISMVVGGVRSYQEEVSMDTISTIEKTIAIEQKFLAYPNPVNAGSMLTVKFPENNIPEKMQLISISGQIIATVEQDISDYATMCNIRIPSHVAAGVYFLRLVSKEKILSTIKIIVNK